MKKKKLLLIIGAVVVVIALVVVNLTMSSNNGISAQVEAVSLKDIEEIMKLRGEVTVYNFPFPSFTARRNLLKGHEEYIFYCRVTRSVN